MRVLHIGLCKNKGGIESFAINYFRALQPQGVVFDFVDIYGEGLAYEEEIKSLGGEIITLPSFKKKLRHCKKALINYMKGNMYDAVHIHVQTTAYIFPITAALKAKVKPIVHVHFSAVSGIARKVLHVINVRRLRQLDLYRFSSGEASGKWFWGVRDFSILPNAIHTEKFVLKTEDRQKIRTQFSVAENTVLIGYVGRLEPVKNPLFALDIVQACKQRNLKIKLLLIGDGSLRQEVLERIKRLDIENEVSLVGYTSEVPCFLSAMDLYLMPSLSEAFSIAAIEAQTNGLPCLFSKGLPEEMQISQSCRFIPLNELEKWVDAIEEIALNGQSRKGADDSVLQSKFNMKIAKQLLLDIYTENKAGQ